MYRLRLYLPITLALFLSLGMQATDASAANRYWVGSTSPDNWADDADWSASSGNSCGSGGGASYPTGTDTAIFTSDCENDVTLDAAVTVGAITNTGGYTGTFTLAGYDVDVSGNFQWDGGMFDASTGTPTITVGGDWDSSAGTFNYGTSTVKMIGTNKTFKPSGSLAWTWNLTIGDGVNPASVTLQAGNWRYVAANDLVLADNASLTLTAVFDYLPATGDLTLGTGATLNITTNLTRRINDSSSHISGIGAFGGAGTFQYDIVAGSVAAPVTARTYGCHLAVSGALDATGVLGGGASLDLGTKTLYLYDRNTNNNTYGILDNPGNIPVTAAALQVGATGGGNQPWKTGKLICRGAVYTFTNVTVYSSNTAAPTIDCSTGGQSSVWNVSGNVTIDDVKTYKGLITAGSSTWTVGGDWANTPGGTFTPGTSTVTFNGSNQTLTGSTIFYNLSKSITNADTLSFESLSTQTISNQLTLNGASGQLLTLARSGGAGLDQWNINLQTGGLQSLSYLNVSDSNAAGLTLIAGATSTDGGNNTKWIFGGTTLTWTGTTNSDWDEITNWDSGIEPRSIDTVIIPDATTTPNDPVLNKTPTVAVLTVQTNGILDLNGNSLNVSGDLTIDGTIDASTGTPTITVGGNWTNNGTFTAGTGRVTFNGTNQSLTGSTTFYNLTKSVTSAATLTFDNTATQTITNALILNGISGRLLSLSSDAGGQQWDIDPQGTRNISYVDVQDSNNINTTWILALNSASSGNNTGWYFGNHTEDVDSDGTDEVAMDTDGNIANGYEIYSDPDCPTPGPGKICSSTVLSMDGDRDNKTDHFIDTSGDAVPEKWWDPDEYIIQDIELMDVNRDGSDEWVYDSDNNGTFDFAYNRSGSRFIDPFGIVFESATNNEIAGAVVTIYRSATGIPALPGTDLAGGDVNPVITGANGTYGFNAVAGDYYITVTADGYSYPFEPDSKTFDTGRTICVNNAAAGYPSAACQGQYGSRGEIFSVSTVITMDHPLDPSYNLIKLTKKANKTEANTGDIVTYTITIESKATTDLKNVYITDKIPPGFKYITDRAILDNQKTDNPEGQRPVKFNIGTIKAGQKRILKYQLIIGSGVTFSKYENSAWANYSNGTRISNVAAEEVKIIPDPLFDLGTVIGKVFRDRNENGIQDSSDFNSEEQSTVDGETGLANIQIMTEEGTIITTGKDGKYHLAGITPGRHILRIDERTLPDGAYLTTDKAVIVDITPGIIRKVNFGINKRQSREPGREITNNQDGLESIGHSSPAEAQSTDNDFIFVALADIKAGYTDVTGNIEPVGNDNSFKSGFWSEGRLAYYLKGRIKGKYLITSSIDTDREKKELFRKLDPDKYYPVYGDASTVNYEATDTQGMLYLSIEWDKNKAIWGNYHTEITDTELAQFNRTLYGGKLHYETVSTSKAGEPLTKLLIFYARAKQKAAHNEFLGTGGSLYYLKHRPIVEGSDKVFIEIRDKNTGSVITKVVQSEGDDYEIDYSNGRIMFYLPVSQIAQSNSIISTAILDGNPLYIVVDYEYEINDLTYDESSYGGRAEQSLIGLISNVRNRLTEYRSQYSDTDNRQKTESTESGDKSQETETDIVERTTVNEYKGWIKDIRLGGTYIKDDADKYELNKYELKGIDLTTYLGEHTKITGEYATSKDPGISGFISTDGGLSFSLMDNFSLTETSRGKALSINAETYLFDRLDIKAYHKRVDRGFSSTSTLSEQGKQVTGGAAALEITPETHLNLSYDTQKLLDGGNALTALQTGARRTDISTARITHDMDKLKLTGEYRHIYVKEKSAIYESETNEQGDTAALRTDYVVKKDLNVFAEQQITLNGEDNHQTTGGVSARLFGRLKLNVQHTKGTKGTATSIGTIAKIDSKTELYNTYSTNRSYIYGRKRTITTGAKNKITESMNLTTETRQNSSGTEDSRTNSFGLSGKINDRWGMTGGFESGTVQSVSGSISKRNAGSIGVSYIKKERINTSIRLEIRKDDGDEDRQQYLSYNAVQWKVNRDTTLFGKVNLSESRNTTMDTTEARYKELVIGSAYRPVNFDRLNLLAKYTYLEDRSASGQSDMSDIEERMAHILSGEAIYDLTAKWQLMGKIAFKSGEEKVTGFDFTKSQTWLWINRINYRLNRKWELGAEYRILSQRQAKDTKQGALIEVARSLGKNIQLGAGYNFTDFSDNLTYLDYSAYGPFIRLSAKITD